MTTEKQIQANRLNAQKSTGPTSIEGKAVASLNALKHGLRARTVVLPMENRQEFDFFLQELTAEHQPEGAQERMLVEQMAISWWRLARLGVMEQGAYESRRGDVGAADTKSDWFHRTLFYNNSLRQIAEMEARLERSYYRALDRLEKLQKARGRDLAATPSPAPVE